PAEEAGELFERELSRRRRVSGVRGRVGPGSSAALAEEAGHDPGEAHGDRDRRLLLSPREVEEGETIPRVADRPRELLREGSPARPERGEHLLRVDRAREVVPRDEEACLARQLAERARRIPLDVDRLRAEARPLAEKGETL